MANQGKVIITCALTGAIHKPSMSPPLPVTAEEIAEGALGAPQDWERPYLEGNWEGLGQAVSRIHSTYPA